MQFFNTLSQQKETFQSLAPNKVKMYCCGITPYSNIHLGHMRTFFSYDLLYRILRDQGYEVEWARNITDIDDKIIIKAYEAQTSCDTITSRYIAEQNTYLKIFDLHPPMFEPRVTENIPQIIEMIEKLIANEFAYVSTSGVYFRVRKFPNYGKLSKNKIDDLKKGARIEIDETKEDALDFALWKFGKSGEVFWKSPWGKGRPGWHIECSAMIHTLFGDSIDIHMGGRDLIFPHHEAEIAQSEACTGCTLAKYWLHCGMVTLYQQKMSKSTNHYITIEHFLSKYPAEVLRLLFLSSSYSQPLDFTFELAGENLKKLTRIYRFVAIVDNYLNLPHESTTAKPHDILVFSPLPQLKERMRDLLTQDMNSTSALAVLFEFISTVNAQILKLEKNAYDLLPDDQMILKNHWPDFKSWINKTFALFSQKPNEFFEQLKKFGCEHQFSDEEIQNKIEQRNKLREQKDWKASDGIRNELSEHGVQIMDTPRGTKWFLK